MDGDLLRGTELEKKVTKFYQSAPKRDRYSSPAMTRKINKNVSSAHPVAHSEQPSRTSLVRATKHPLCASKYFRPKKD